MTKQEIKDLVAAKIAGQGTQVDLGGALPEIINAIVDSMPDSKGGLVVKGTVNGVSGHFIPSEGEPTFEEAFSAIEEGINVFIDTSNGSISPAVAASKISREIVFSLHPDAGGGEVTWGGE